MDGTRLISPRIYPPSRSANTFPPSKTLSRSDRWKLTMFLHRIDELCANWDDYVAHGYAAQKPVNAHRAKALYVDFRFFIAKKEPVNLAKTMRLLRPRFRRAAVHRFLGEVQHDWNTANGPAEPAVGNMERFIASRFNTEIFHCDPRKDRPRAGLDQLTRADADHIITTAIGARVAVLRRLAIALAPLRSGVDEFHLP